MTSTIQLPSDAPFSPEQRTWLSQLLGQVLTTQAAATASAVLPEQEAEDTGYSKTRPFPSEPLANRNLNGPGSKETHHLAFNLEGSGLTYEVGDALGVYPQNCPELVNDVLSRLPFTGEEEVPGRNGETVSLREALEGHYEIGVINKMLVTKWAANSECSKLRTLVDANDKQAWSDFCWGRELIDLASDHPTTLTDAKVFTSVLKKLQPRLYSISSSPNAHPGEVHLCVGIVRYESNGRKRGGACSTFFADRMAEDTLPGVFVHSNPAFRLPEDGSRPVIMVGPGTGIAPFRAFLEERRASAATGPNWLFFGNPHRATDFLYEDEINGFLDDGTLTRLELAWSRDQETKVYVQNLMVTQGAELWKWLEEGAAFYVCGDASRMAKDVDAALHAVCREHGGLSEQEAAAYLNQLKKEKRYLRDVY